MEFGAQLANLNKMANGTLLTNGMFDRQGQEYGTFHKDNG